MGVSQISNDSNSKTDLQLFYWPTPNGKKITIFLEEAKLPYTIKALNIGQGAQSKPGFKALNPNMKMPVLVDPSGPGGEELVIFESGAILQYLGRKTGAFYPITERSRANVDQWLMFQMSAIGPVSAQCYHFRGLKDDETQAYSSRRFTKELTRLYGVLDQALTDCEFIAGSYSIADMALYPWILPKPLGQDMSEFPHLQAWRERMAGRAGVQAGMHVGSELRQAV